MAGGFTADTGVMDGLAQALSRGADALNSLAGSVPAVPDAGAVSGRMAALMAKQVDAAGEIAVGVAAAADAVRQGGRAYVESDQAARQSLPQVH